MGYWAKDGSYQYDDNDLQEIKSRESEVERAKRREVYSKEEASRKAGIQAQKDYEIFLKRQEYENESKRTKEVMEQLDKAREQEEERKNLKRYGTDINLRAPKNLEDRRARANFWRTQSKWSTLINVINGKSKKFDKLWNQYRTATEEERQQIVEEMERLFPTTERNIKQAERDARKGR